MEPDINPDIRRRIIAAADQLHEQHGRGAFPNVDAVRRSAKVNMNDASAVMKQWRRMLGTKAAPVPLQVPDDVQKANLAGLEQLWTAAQECANQNLRTAQAGWELERAESEVLCQQLSSAFDAQAQQTAELQQAHDQARQARDEAEARRAALAAELEATTGAARAMQSRAMASEGRASELEQRATDLNKALERLHADHQRCHDKEEAARQRHAASDVTLRAELQSAAGSATASAIELARLLEQVRGLEQRLHLAASQVEHLKSLARRTTTRRAPPKNLSQT